jgi:hypothetical protein
MSKNRINKEGFSKLSTGEIPVSTDPVELMNRSGQVPVLISIYQVVLYR